MAEQEMDAILARTEQALAQLDAVQGRLVRLPRAELELLEQLEASRDLMMSVLQSKERSLLTRIFGGDCVRISRARAVLEAVRFSSTEDRRVRLRTCLSACESVEQVLGDLGLGFALRLAQQREKALLTQRRCCDRFSRGVLAEAPQVFAPRARPGEDAPDIASASGPRIEQPLQRAVPGEELPVAPIVEQALSDPLPSARQSLRERMRRAVAAEVQLRPSAAPTEEQEFLRPEGRDGGEEEEQTSAQQQAAEAAPLPEPQEEAEGEEEDPAAGQAAVREEPKSVEEQESRYEESVVLPEPLEEERPLDEQLEEASVAGSAEGSVVLPEPLEEEKPLDEQLEEEESVVLPEPLEEEKLMDEQLEEEAAAATAKAAMVGAADTPCAKTTGLSVPRRPSSAQAAAALRDIVHPISTAADHCVAEVHPISTAADHCVAEVDDKQDSVVSSPGPALEPEAEPVVHEPGECTDSSPDRSDSTPEYAEREHVQVFSRVGSEGGELPDGEEVEAAPCSESEGSEWADQEDSELLDFDSSCLLELPDWLERLLQRLFAFYAGTDGTTAGVGIGLTRFRSFLRDAGLLRGHGQGDASAAMQSLSQTTDELQGQPSGARRRSSRMQTGALSLPLQIFAVPPLTLVQADIMHVTARERQPVIRSYMTCDAFFWAVADIAVYCRQRGMLDCGSSPDEIVVAFCERVIVPLGEFLGLGDQELRVALALRDEAAPLFQRARQGFAAAFARYAKGVNGPEPYRRGHWTLQALRRFTSDLDLVAEMSHSAMQRVFDTCVQHEVSEGRCVEGLMSFACWKLAFIMIAQRVHNAPDCSPIQRLALLMLRLGAAYGAGDLGVAARSVVGAATKTRRGVLSQTAQPSRATTRASLLRGR